MFWRQHSSCFRHKDATESTTCFIFSPPRWHRVCRAVGVARRCAPICERTPAAVMRARIENIQKRERRIITRWAHFKCSARKKCVRPYHNLLTAASTACFSPWRGKKKDARVLWLGSDASTNVQEGYPRVTSGEVPDACQAVPSTLWPKQEMCSINGRGGLGGTLMLREHIAVQPLTTPTFTTA